MTGRKVLKCLDNLHSKIIRSSFAENVTEKEIMALIECKKILKELEQYRAIGTVEQFRESMEKQRAKIPYTYGDGDADGYPVIDMYECPNCGETYEIECDHYDYCPKCGQHMDKSDKVFE